MSCESWTAARPPQTPRGPGNIRDCETSLQPSLWDFSPGLECTQDFILGYFQPSLRDWIGDVGPASNPGVLQQPVKPCPSFEVCLSIGSKAPFH